MDPIPIGRTLDDVGEPVPGTGFAVEPEGVVAERLRERLGPLVSNPVSDEWLTELEQGTGSDGEQLRGLYVIAGEGPPPHYHVGYEERFEVLQGELVIDRDGSSHRVGPGETHVVPPGTVHAPRYDGDEYAAAIGTVHPPGQTLDLIMTQFGLTHEGKVDGDGQPGALQGMVMTAAFADDTVFTSPPPALTRPLSAVVAPVARALGYRATYPKYETTEFWEQHVEQPRL